MVSLTVYVVLLSCLLQYSAAFAALRLIKTTGYSVAWVFISSALFIMAVRRTAILVRALKDPTGFILDPVSEWFGLCISILLLLGALAIASFFKQKQREARELHDNEWLLERSQKLGHIGSYRIQLPSFRWTSTKALDEILGIGDDYQRDEEGFARLVHPDDREELRRYSREEVIEKKKPFSYQHRIVRPKDGGIRWIEGMGILELDEKGNPSALVGTMQDITERMTGMIQLLESEKKYRSIVDNVNDGLVIHDLEGKILDCNNNILQRLGYSREEFVAKTIPEITAPGQETLWVEKIQELRDVGKVEGDGVLLHKDGSPVAIMISARLISGEGRGIIQSFMRDITERKAVEWALRTSEQRFRILSESLPQGVFESDEKGHILYCNRSALQMFGYDDADLLRGLNVVETVVPEEREMAGENFRRVMEGRAITRGNEYQGIRKDGTRFPVSIFTNPKIEDGRVKGALGVVVDLTELKKGEEERRRLQEQLFQAQKLESIGTLAGGIAHDFNNLLGGLLGSLSILEAEAEGQPSLQYEVGEMKGLVKRGAGLTKQLLGFARRGKYDAKPLALREVLSLTLDLFRRTRKDIVIQNNISSVVRNVLGDRSQIEQVLMNLFVNAGQAMTSGGTLMVFLGEHRIESEEAESHGVLPGVYARLRVADTGVGIPPQALPHVFEPFFTTKTPGKGTGLGLASVYGIVKNHGGYVEVESEVGKGSVFTVVLPTTELPVAREAEKPRNALDGAVFKKRTILVVDDEEHILRTYAKVLRDMGFEVLPAKDGPEALGLFRSRREDVAAVILDMVMPGMGGAEVFEALKAIEPGVRVLLASGYSRDGQANRLLEAGCQGFIQKPFDARELAEKLKEVLGGH